MPLPASGAISLGAVSVILGNSGISQISLGATGVRTLYNVPSGAIRLAADGYGKSLAVPGTYTLSSFTNFDTLWQVFFNSLLDQTSAAALLATPTRIRVYIYDIDGMNKVLDTTSTIYQLGGAGSNSIYIFPSTIATPTIDSTYSGPGTYFRIG